MKEHLSYEPNRGLSLVKEPCRVILTWTTMWGRCPCPHSLVVRYDRREMTQSRQVMRTLWLEVIKNRLICWPSGFIKILGSLTNCFVFHVSSKYLINYCTVMFVVVGCW